MLNTKLAGKTLGETSDDEDDVVAWVRKQKKFAEKKAKEIEELEAKVEREAKQYQSGLLLQLLARLVFSEAHSDSFYLYYCYYYYIRRPAGLEGGA